jgi:hypothetical protein
MKPYVKPTRGKRPRADTCTPTGAYMPPGEGTVESFARFPRLLVWVRGNSAGRRDFAHFIRTNEVASERSDESGNPLPVHAYADAGRMAFVLYGAPCALEPLRHAHTRPRWCLSAENVSNAAVPRASGSGPEKSRSKAQPPKPPPLTTDKERRGVQGLN